MSASERIPLEQIMPPRRGSVDPSAFPDEEFELYSIPAFDQGAPEILTGSRIGSAKQVVCSGDVLLSRIVPHIRRAWVVGKQNGRRLIASGEWIVFRGDDADPGYLRQVLVSDRFHAEFMRTVSGVGGSLLRARPANVAKIEIPLPPLLEQRRIAAILDQADALRVKRRTAIQKLDELTQSIFLDMFGDPATNPKGWPIKALGDLASKFSDGPFGSNLKSKHYTDSGVRVVRLQNIGIGEFIDDDAAYISDEHFARLKKHECRPGDVLVGTLGDPNLRACIQPKWLTVALNKADCVQIRPNTHVANAVFICGLLNQPSTERMAQNLMLGQTRVRISMGRLRALLVPVPPIEVQREYELRAGLVENLKTEQQSAQTHAAVLFASLQQLAFRGEL